MNKQEIFDKVLTHMRKQKVNCNAFGGCMYYDKETNNKCAIGCLIPIEMYKPEFDDLDLNLFTSVRSNKYVQETLMNIGINLNHDMLLFLSDLQNVHDCMVDEWGDCEETAMISIASKNGLNYSEP